MRHRYVALVYLCAAALLLAVGGPAHGYIADDRWNRTATNSTTGPRGTPITLTWSFAPDGTGIPGITSGTVDSSLISFLDGRWGAGPGGSDLTQRPWFTYFEQSFARISALSGVTYLHEPNDDGRAFSQSNAAQGVLGVRGDVRLGGRSYGSGSNTLASNYFPDYGEMIINTDKGSYFSNATNNYRRLRNTLMHELMHGLGISHVQSSNANFLIEPTLGTSFDGPQLDDLLAIQRLYGDFYEKNGGNDTYDRATPLGLLTANQPIAVGAFGDSTVIGSSQVDFLSIDDFTDTDFFSFSLPDRLDVQLLLSPRGTSYLVGPENGTQTTLDTLALANLSLALLDTNGTSLLSVADNNAAGLGEELIRQLLPGTYYTRIKSSNSDIQLYGLNLAATIPLPANLLWVGNLSADWAVGVANFSDGAAAAAFYDNDHVTFDDTSAVHAVDLPGDVATGNMLVNTAGSYLFSGPGGIVADSLTVSGPGVVELANTGSSSYAATQVDDGTLRVSGAALFGGAVHVAQDATLELAGGQVFDTSSHLTGRGQITGDTLMPGTIAPGDSAGILTFADRLTLADTSLVQIELGGIEQGSEYDALVITGAADLDGTLDVSLSGEFLPALDATFEVLRAEAGIFGAFDQIALPALAAELAWNVIYSNFALMLQVINPNAAGLPGDFNQDGAVDAADYVVWRKGLGTTYTLEQYDEWLENFGQTSGTGADSTVNFSSSPAVPEPAALVLALLAGIMGLAARRR